MVVKNSEYRRAYKDGGADYVRQSYEGGLTSRNERRQRECWHSHDPFSWNVRDLNDIESETNLLDCRPKSVPLHRYKHELFNNMYQERSGHHGRKSIARSPVMDVVAEDNPPSAPKQAWGCDQQVQTDQKGIGSVSPVGPSPDELAISLGSPDSDAKPESGISSKPKNPKNKILTKKASKPRPSTAPSRASAGTKVTTVDDQQKAPFVPYGFKYKAKETGVKKTHNVRASSDVSNGALIAMRRRQVEKEQQQKEVKRATIIEIQRAQFLEKMRRETADWDTEYRQNYIGYNNEYQKNLSARLNPRKVWQCLYVP